MDPLTVEEFKTALPDQVQKSVNAQLIAEINQTLSDPDLYETYRDNLMSYGRVMQEGKFKISQYIHAVKYVSFKLMGMTNIEAFSRTFPDKIKRWTTTGVTDKDMSSYVSAYNKSKLVNLIYGQSLIPSWVLNQDLHQKAINVQADLMLTANSEKVRTDAANSLLTHLKPPETAKVELEVKTRGDSAIDQLRRATEQLVIQTKQSIQAGSISTSDAARRPVVIDQFDDNDEEAP